MYTNKETIDIDALRTDIAAAFSAVRTGHPLIHNITNYVVMEITANALLAAGASPLMAHAPEELDEILRISDALVLNIGTIDSLWALSMKRAGRLAAQHGVPVVLDPVGAGASALRTVTSKDLLMESCPTVVRGNASEIMALADGNRSPCGVDSRDGADDAAEAAEALSEEYGSVVSVSGEADLVIGDGAAVHVKGGSQMMTLVTGMGCTATALTAACLAGAIRAGVSRPAFVGAVTAMCLMAEAGGKAAGMCTGPGSFLPAFIDCLHAARPDGLGAHAVL